MRHCKLYRRGFAFSISYLLLNFCAAASNGRNEKAGASGERVVSLKMQYKVIVNGHLNSMWLKMVVPDDIKDRQTVKSMSYSPEPDSIYKKNGNMYALFKFRDLEESFKITVKCRLVIYKTVSDKNTATDSNFSRYLRPEQFIESACPAIIQLADSLKQNTDIETVMKTFDYVKRNIHYELNQAIGAEKVLESRVGKCMDFSDLFVALLRANRIPAKSDFGIDVDCRCENPLHAWPEAYLKKQGWIRFDPTTGHSDIENVAGNYVMHISNKYIVLSEGRNEPELRTWQYYYGCMPAPGAELKVKLSFDIAALE